MPEENKDKDYGKAEEKMKESLRDVARLLGQASSIVSAIVGAGYSAASYYKSLEDEVKKMIGDATAEIVKCTQALTEAQKKVVEDNVMAEVTKRVDAKVGEMNKELASLKELLANVKKS